MSLDDVTAIQFSDLSLTKPVLKALEDVGYETPTPIQAQIIPHVLAGRDVIGQAQTGTGKTAAFALPILSKIDASRAHTQVLVLTPTRELAIQVAEAFQKYASHMKNFHVLPIYGGQDYRGQLRQLERGAHVVVGTPGRIMDHMRRGTLKLNNLTCLVLDEADEMLRMGFIDDVDWILQQAPEKRQVALFSATMPKEIRRIAQSHLVDPIEISVKVKTTTAETVRQRYWVGHGGEKLDVLTRILEAETFDGMIIFVRTKTAAVELSEKLEARGYATAALNGDIPQAQRERIIVRLKNAQLDILVATDVAARGLDVDRITHVINYDIPYDAEAYVHRIGRTGRAGRTGDAILFVSPREKRLLYSIEKSTNQRIEPMQLPSTTTINDQRTKRFKQKITETLENKDIIFFQKIVEEYQFESGIPMAQVAAALAKLVQGDKPFFLKDKPVVERERTFESKSSDSRSSDKDGKFGDKKPRKSRLNSDDKTVFERYRIEVGRVHGVKPGNIVGAIANEVDLSSDYIGEITLHDDHSFVDLPEGMPKPVFQHLHGIWVSGQQLKISRASDAPTSSAGKEFSPRPPRERSSFAKPASGEAKPQVKFKKTYARKKEEV
ncbi:MAG: DEAD/DEAH box helicase [Pseudomonadota bacterium]